MSGLCAWKGLPFEPTFYGLGEEAQWRRFENMVPGGSIRIGATEGRVQKSGWYIVDRRMSAPLALGHWGPQGEEYIWTAMANSAVYEIAIQAAFWLGFDAVYILGEDQRGSGHVYEGYNLHSTKHMSTIELAAQTCLREYGKAGKTLINCTPNSAVKNLPFKALEVVL